MAIDLTYVIRLNGLWLLPILTVTVTSLLSVSARQAAANLRASLLGGACLGLSRFFDLIRVKKYFNPT